MRIKAETEANLKMRAENDGLASGAIAGGGGGMGGGGGAGAGGGGAGGAVGFEGVSLDGSPIQAGKRGSGGGGRPGGTPGGERKSFSAPSGKRLVFIATKLKQIVARNEERSGNSFEVWSFLFYIVGRG